MRSYDSTLELPGSDQLNQWWGEFQVPLGTSRIFRIGPLKLTISRLRHEWRISRDSTKNPFDMECSVREVSDPVPLSAAALVSRFGVDDDNETLSLTPILPDRSVVTRPVQPVTIPPKQRSALYVGLPIWLRIETPLAELGEYPAYQPTETWWGQNTREGEICYATMTYGRLRLEETVFYPHLAITVVRLANQSSAPLVIERLNLPVRGLSVFANTKGRLWTEEVVLRRAAGNEFAELEVGKNPPPEARASLKLSEARSPLRPNFFFRAFGSLFG